MCTCVNVDFDARFSQICFEREKSKPIKKINLPKIKLRCSFEYRISKKPIIINM